jgi:hypothetical protein
MADGSKQRLFCKYSDGQANGDFGHRGGVAYEAEVYRQILQRSQTSTPRFYGSRLDSRTGKSWCVLEYIGGSLPLDHSGRGQWLKAARWIARFHAAHAARVSERPLAFLRHHDARYYRDWARRATRLAAPLRRGFPWLAPLAERFGQEAVPLLLAAPTVIHGEYYPLNILVRRGVIHPVDWESAAVAAGEIDLASLTEGWPDRLVRQCEQAYREARWPAGAPPDFEVRLEAARLYLGWRWLAGAGDEALGEEELWYIEHLQAAGQRLGWLRGCSDAPGAQGHRILNEEGP